MIHVQSTLQFKTYQTSKGNIRVSIHDKLSLEATLFGPNNNYNWVTGQGAVYVLHDPLSNKYIYVGESTSNKSPLTTISRGLNRSYSYGFKGVIHSVTAHFFTFGPTGSFGILNNFPQNKRIKYLIETIEAELAFLIRISPNGNGNWPLFQNEIHFRSDINQDPDIQNEINQVKNKLGL